MKLFSLACETNQYRSDFIAQNRARHFRLANVDACC